MEPIFFESAADLRKWFEKHHETESELLAGFYKTLTGKKSPTWSQSVDEALCFGWIDGIRRSIDDSTYQIRFTPRRPGSNWSAVNIRKVEELISKGLMQPAGLKAYAMRKEHLSRVYSYESSQTVAFDKSLEDRFRQNGKAWEYFQSQAPSYRKVTTRWVMQAKQETTRLKRLAELISSCVAGEWIRGMRWGQKKKAT